MNIEDTKGCCFKTSSMFFSRHPKHHLRFSTLAPAPDHPDTTPHPIPSMYGIFTIIYLHEWLIFMGNLNIDKYTIHGCHGNTDVYKYTFWYVYLYIFMRNMYTFLLYTHNSMGQPIGSVKKRPNRLLPEWLSTCSQMKYTSGGPRIQVYIL